MPMQSGVAPPGFRARGTELKENNSTVTHKNIIKFRQQAVTVYYGADVPEYAKYAALCMTGYATTLSRMPEFVRL